MGGGVERRGVRAPPVHVEHEVGLCGAATWRLVDAVGEPVVTLAANVERLQRQDLDELTGALDRISARRRLRAL